MKKLLYGLVFIVVGLGLWTALSNTARYSIKRWDAKFDTTLRTGLSSLGLRDSDLISSFNEVIEDENGEYVLRRVSMKMMDRTKRTELMKRLADSGAHVIEKKRGKSPVLLVQRHGRTYQEIQFLPEK